MEFHSIAYPVVCSTNAVQFGFRCRHVEPIHVSLVVVACAIHGCYRRRFCARIKRALPIKFTESSVVSAHVLGSLLLPLFPLNLPIQKKNMAALVTSTLHLPQAHPKNKIPYTKLDSITENRKKNQRFQRKVGGLIVAGSLFFFVVFLFFSVFVFFWWFCLLYRLSIGVVLP